MVNGPMRATLDDYDSIIELVDECFPGDRDGGGMLARWPHCYIPKPNKIRNCLIIKDGTKVVSNVEYVDQTLLVEGTEVKVAGITGVATWPTHRNLGFMTQLLNYCMTLMREDGYAFSDLGGDRLRYGRFGWERAGRQWWFDVTRRSFKAVDAPLGYEISQYRAHSDEIEATFALHGRETLCLKRTRDLHKMLLGRKGNQVWLARSSEGIAAYVVSRPGEMEQDIVEFGGAPGGVHAIIWHLSEVPGFEALHVFSPWQHPLNATFFSISARWNVDCQRMIKILDLGATLRGFANQLRERYRELGLQGSRTITLGLDGTDHIVEVRFSPEEVAVRKVSDSSRALKLSERQMVRLIFGPGSPSTEFNLPPNARFLEGLLPVDFYIWGNEAV